MLALGQSKHQAKFLSTLSLRRATSFDFCIICLPSYFYPRSPCGERQLCEGNRAAEPYFYPRSPCGERPLTDDVSTGGKIFLSTLSLRRATVCSSKIKSSSIISIHALLAESDHAAVLCCGSCHHFYPRSPCGERLYVGAHSAGLNIISIHALLAESDSTSVHTRLVSMSFLSTLSLRRATLVDLLQCPGTGISIHALLAESDTITDLTLLPFDISIHALLAESDLIC